MFNYNYSYMFFITEINKAKQDLRVEIPIDIEYYIVNNLELSLSNNNIGNINQITNFLEQNFQKNKEQKQIADNCLIISGMFPKRSLYIGAGDITPIIWVGTQAYFLQHSLTKDWKFLDLAENFISYMDLLLVMSFKIKPFYLPYQAIKQLQELNSKYPNYLAKL